MGFLKFLNKTKKDDTPSGLADNTGLEDAPSFQDMNNADQGMPSLHSDIDIPPTPPSASYEGSGESFPVPPIDADKTKLDMPEDGTIEPEIPLPPIGNQNQDMIPGEQFEIQTPDVPAPEPVQVNEPVEMAPEPTPEALMSAAPTPPMAPVEEHRAVPRLATPKPVAEVHKADNHQFPSFSSHKYPLPKQFSDQRAFQERVVDFAQPIYVKLNTYQGLLDTIDDIHSHLGSLDSSLERLNEFETEGDNTYEKWRKGIEGIQKKVMLVDSKLFKR